MYFILMPYFDILISKCFHIDFLKTLINTPKPLQFCLGIRNIITSKEYFNVHCLLSTNVFITTEEAIRGKNRAYMGGGYINIVVFCYL